MSGSHNEILLGFDARDMRRTELRAASFEETIARRFLLRTDLDDVLSADAMIWPSMFQAGARLPRPAWIGPNDPFWEDLPALRRSLPAGAPTGDIALVAATWLASAPETRRDPQLPGPRLSATNPAQRDPAWIFLGFDVTDGGFISGLSNCGYAEEERELLAARWAPALNRSHLFDDLEQASEFRTMTDSRVKEHAPFFVVGLWRIPQEAPDPS